jgi:hypothetical protein
VIIKVTNHFNTQIHRNHKRYWLEAVMGLRITFLYLNMRHLHRKSKLVNYLTRVILRWRLIRYRLIFLRVTTSFNLSLASLPKPLDEPHWVCIQWSFRKVLKMWVAVSNLSLLVSYRASCTRSASLPAIWAYVRIIRMLSSGARRCLRIRQFKSEVMIGG